MLHAHIKIHKTKLPIRHTVQSFVTYQVIYRGGGGGRKRKGLIYITKKSLKSTNSFNVIKSLHLIQGLKTYIPVNIQNYAPLIKLVYAQYSKNTDKHPEWIPQKQISLPSPPQLVVVVAAAAVIQKQTQEITK
jgi:hypothetical protein